MKSHIDTARENLNASKGFWKVIEKETGLQHTWLSKFARGKIPNPGYRQIETLSAYFAKASPRRSAKAA